MNRIHSNTAETIYIAPGDLHELVRGEEQCLVERLTPVVRRQSVMLDLSRVDRIDAAGIAALISLYGTAQNAGNEFNIVHASHRVADILTLVGLDHFLLSHDAAPCPPDVECAEMPAA
ncbi:MAG TPA: STAS domain-containing protein [Terracidiphilus sp.]|nr:STAS domain-containing protein [Terracidiphilus sp.]